MMETNELIRHLVDRSGQTKRLPPPWQRLLVWLGYATPYVVLVVLVTGWRQDLASKVPESRFMVEQIAALVTALTAGFAAFLAVIPGRPRWPLLLPVLPFAVWLGTLGQGCLQDWKEGSLVFTFDWPCLPEIALTGAAPAVVMAFMIRRGAPLYPHLAVALGGLAAAALGNVGHQLTHQADASFTGLVWHFGTVALLTAVAGTFGPMVHSWRHVSVAP